VKQYDVIYADPPWGYQNWTDAKNGAAVSAYKVLKDRDIIALPVHRIASPDSLCFMWCTWPKIEVGLAALKQWGFKYVTTPFVWNKTNAAGKPHHGVGFWTMGNTEFVLMGRRGKGIPRRKETRGKKRQLVNEYTESLVLSPVREHSSKPPEVRDHILDIVSDHETRIELFARESVEGWDVTGLDLDGVDIRDFLPALSEAEL